MFHPSPMAPKLSFSASSRRISNVRRSLTCPGTGEGFARRATASPAATSGARAAENRRFGSAAKREFWLRIMVRMVRNTLIVAPGVALGALDHLPVYRSPE